MFFLFLFRFGCLNMSIARVLRAAGRLMKVPSMKVPLTAERTKQRAVPSQQSGRRDERQLERRPNNFGLPSCPTSTARTLTARAWCAGLAGTTSQCCRFHNQQRSARGKRCWHCRGAGFCLLRIATELTTGTLRVCPLWVSMSLRLQCMHMLSISSICNLDTRSLMWGADAAS
jgi:hypothetical protein